MPRTKRPAGTTADRRNGRRAELAVVRAEDAADVPALPAGVTAELARAAWSAYWSDPVSGIVTDADRVVAVRWVMALNRYVMASAAADAEPMVVGSTGQPRPNGLYAVAKDALAEVTACERQLGIGPHNRADLGISVAAERRSLAELNARYAAPAAIEAAPVEDDDPRLGDGQA